MSDVPPESKFAFSRDGLSRLGRLVRKELTEILRDRRTILTLVVMPVLLYPLMAVAFQQYFVAAGLAPEYRIGCSMDEKILIEPIIKGGMEPAMGTSDEPARETKPAASKKPPKLKIVESSNSDDLVRKNQIDVSIHLLNLAEFLRGKTRILQTKAVYQPGSASAFAALALFEDRLAVRNQRELERLIGIDPNSGGLLVKLQRAPLPETGTGGTISLAALVPLILILMTITGAVYPAIDLTAGERERGTLEILVAAPVPRLGLLFAKYVAVVTVAILTALVNLVAMVAVLTWSGFGHQLFGKIPVVWILAILGLLILFALFFSAVLLILTSFARSFKEAQAYLIPLMLAALGPGVIGIMPGLKLTGILAVTPLINIVLLARDIFEGGADPLLIFLVTSSTLLYALIALSLAAKIFGAEEVLYNEQTSWSDLWRRPRKPQTTASVSGALLCLALMVPCNFLLQTAFRNFVLPAPEELKDYPLTLITALSVASIMLFVLYPSLAAYLGKVGFRTGFSLVKAPWPTLAGGALLGLSLWPFVAQFTAFFHTDLSALDQEKINKVLESIKDLGPGIAIVFGVAALAEEFFFRGYLFSALSRGNKPLTVIVLTAVMFGLMHCLVEEGLFERFLPTTALGLVLGTVRWYSKSVYPGMVLHLVHNVLLVIILESAGLSGEDVPTSWLIFGAAGLPLGAGLVYWGMTTKPRGEVLRTPRVTGDRP